MTAAAAVPRSAGSAVIVRVHPTRTTLDEERVGDGGGGDNEEDC